MMRPASNTHVHMGDETGRECFKVLWAAQQVADVLQILQHAVHDQACEQQVCPQKAERAMRALEHAAHDQAYKQEGLRSSARAVLSCIR
eukprot:scaffold139544_cov17-Tisochrysis_lutea.AAC.1